MKRLVLSLVALREVGKLIYVLDRLALAAQIHRALLHVL